MIGENKITRGFRGKKSRSGAGHDAKARKRTEQSFWSGRYKFVKEDEAKEEELKQKKNRSSKIHSTPKKYVPPRTRQRSKSSGSVMTPSTFSAKKSPAYRKTPATRRRGRSISARLQSSAAKNKQSETKQQTKVTDWLVLIKEKAEELAKVRKPRRRSSSSVNSCLGIPARRALRKLGRRAGVSGIYGEMAYGQLACELCKRHDDDENMILCDRCDKGFHVYCLRPQLAAVPVGDWFCSNCSGESIAETKKAFKKSKMYFRKNIDAMVKFLKMECFDKSALTVKRRRSLTGGKSTTKSNFRAHRSCAEASRRLDQLASLAAALEVKSIEYITQLHYTDPKRYGPKPRHNNVARDPMQKMTQQNRKVYEGRERLRSQGYCVPVRIEYDRIQGFIAVADGAIPDRTLICEYVGEVGFLVDHLQDDCDSIMDLLRTGKSRTSLIVTPKRMSNMARFLSGVNNCCEKSKRKQNVRSARFAIDGKAHVLLFAARNIAKGERLHYDYNALDKTGYPTGHFS
eukprot:g565.t1